jgi:hypothetical protein
VFLWVSGACGKDSFFVETRGDVVVATSRVGECDIRAVSSARFITVGAGVAGIAA